MCLELWLIQRNTSTKAPWGNLTMCWRKLGRQYHIVVWIQRANFLQGTGFFGQTVDKFTALRVKSQQADPVAMWGGNHSTIRAETKFFDVTPAYIGFFDAVSQSERTTRWDGAHWGSFLEFVHTGPLLVICITWAPKKSSPSFGMELQRCNAITTVPFSRNFWC